ncbi:hypothetical protein H8S90_24335 [Olivibacter sp. SDN3]|uniref:hypothetical protein n=1 Tax=Olivibacter sp. SDN3 TaxID=2764720 RepID=UPI0016511397|nr:hypothetical protein [Olivibacter sp. SDN3]QNL49797.1 hypothetical protein H8S90_24335 [Olivibacter sp. SDN3]
MKTKIIQKWVSGSRKRLNNISQINESETYLSLKESSTNLKGHMDLLPMELCKGYIKTILEKLKLPCNKKQNVNMWCL